MLVLDSHGTDSLAVTEMCAQGWKPGFMLHLNIQYDQTRHVERRLLLTGQLPLSTTLLLTVSTGRLSPTSSHIWSPKNHFWAYQYPWLANIHKWARSSSTGCYDLQVAKNLGFTQSIQENSSPVTVCKSHLLNITSERST